MQRTTTSWNRLVAVAAILIATSFLSGFAFNALLTQQKETQTLKRVTGIGGIFFKCKDPNKMKDWYKTHLGLNTNQYGAVLAV